MILLACPSCDRQYDITSLAPKTKVRCACGERIEVTWREPFVVARLQCAGCGGPVERDDARCRYCGAALPERDRRLNSLCPRCYARIEEDSRHCRACGVEIRPQALQPIPDGKSCPRCKGELRIRVVASDELVECSACEGLWIGAGVFERLCHEAHRAPVPPLPTGGRESRPPAETRVTYIPCLTCGDLMTRRQFRFAGRPAGVILDWCREHGVWLDAQELERVLAFARERRLAGDTAPAGAGGAGSLLVQGGKRPRREPPGSGVARRPPLEAALELLGEIFLGNLF
jgi:Zn-finger nucleic acid-binding protein